MEKVADVRVVMVKIPHRKPCVFTFVYRSNSGVSSGTGIEQAYALYGK